MSESKRNSFSFHVLLPDNGNNLRKAVFDAKTSAADKRKRKRACHLLGKY